jgi:hypothetical protein
MPREKVLIEVSCPFPYKAGGQFFATLAYPKRADGTLRARFLWALCRWGILRRAAEEPKFATNAQPITPAIFTDDYTGYLSALKKGNAKLNQRLVATNWIVFPHLNAVMTGRRASRCLQACQAGNGKLRNDWQDSINVRI